MKRVRLGLRFALVVLLLISLLAGCGGKEEPGSQSTGQPNEGQASGKPVKITFWNTMRDYEAAVAQELINEFEKQNPNIDVEMVTVPFGEAQNKFKVAAQAGNAPDVLRAEVAWIAEFAALGFLEPLDEKFTDQDDFLPSALAYGKWNGKTYAVPQVTDALALLYNKKLLVQAGFHRAPETWDEFVQVAKKLTDPSKDQWGFYMRQSEAYFTLPFIWSFGGGLIDVETMKPLINTEGAIKGLEFVKKLRDEYKVFKDDRDFPNDYNTAMQYFKSGKAAMILNGPWATADILTGEAFKDNPDNLGIAPIPQGPEGNTGSPVGGHSYVIYSKSPHKEEAWKLVQFLSTKEAQAKLALELGLLPTRKSVYEMPEVKANRIISDFKAVMENATPRPVFPQGGLIFEAMDRNFQAFYTGKKTAKEAVEAIVKEWEKLGVKP